MKLEWYALIMIGLFIGVVMTSLILYVQMDRITTENTYLRSYTLNVTMKINSMNDTINYFEKVISYAIRNCTWNCTGGW